ncbi:MAG: hypothetical protein QOE56_935 [Solirubrobacterales bacterium]|jgi:hypothetical protein|nr:hypothetical protein [Solirubrobacterales bacterium]
MRLLASLFGVSVLLLGIALWPACSPDALQVSGRFAPAERAPRTLLPWRPIGLQCERPRTLRLRRFEDGSAWVLCAGRVQARVSVPG